MNAEFVKALLHLSLWLIKALLLSATPTLLCSDRRCVDSRPPHDVTDFEFDYCSFFIVGGNGNTRGNHRGVIRKLRKTASNMIADLTHCH